MKTTLKLSSVSCAIALAAALPGYTQGTTPGTPGEAVPDAHQRQAYAESASSKTLLDNSAQVKDGIPARVNKAKDLIGMQIRNQQDERLGRVKDVVLDLQSGHVAYVVLSTGGFRPRYLALPPSAFTAPAGEKYLVLNADRDKVKHAAGFSKNNWPNMATPSWGAEPFWQAPDGKSYENRGYDKNLEMDKDPTNNKDEEPTSAPPGS